MNKLKKIISMFLAIVMAFTLAGVIVPQSTVEAATTTKSYTFVKGEAWVYTIYSGSSKVKSYSSSNKSVVSVSKNKSNKNAVNLSAKKKGSATITVKMTNGAKTVLKLKVVNPAIEFKIVGKRDSYVTYKVKNKGSVSYSSLYFKYTLKNSKNSTVKSDYESVSYLGAGQSAYVDVYVGDTSGISTSKSYAKIDNTQSRRYLEYKYSSATKYVSYKVSKASDGNFKVKFTNKSKNTVDAVADVVFYDANGKIVDVSTTSRYLTKKSTDTATLYVSSYVKYDHYKVYLRATSTKYIR
ncbi:MAG: hypothetical protein UH963_01975 [Agathobacter sp.]|nr:hypothetical protein [Agathobacter sp.]